MVELDPALVLNLSQAYATSDAFARARGLDLWDVRDVMTTMLVTESYGGYILANDGQGYREPDTEEHRTPWNWDEKAGKPIGTPESRARMRGILKHSIAPEWLAANGLRYDKVGSNGRSTGPAQQLSEETGGAWGPMASTMRMSDSMTLFLSSVNWKDRSSVYKGKQMANWQTAMLLRVQQPLASEVETNYGASQLARAQAIARDPRFAPDKLTAPRGDGLDMATLDDVTKAVAAAMQGVNSSLSEKIPPVFQVYRSSQQNSEYSGKIILASGDHSFWITDGGVLALFRAVGLAETGTREYDDNVLKWVELATNAKELDVGETTEAQLAAAVAAAKKAQADADAAKPKSG